LRRARPSAARLVLGAVTIDFVSRKAWNGSEEIDLTYRDFELLRYLAERPHTVAYRDELLRAVWGYTEAPLTRAVDHAVARLRKKIETDPHKPRFIHTVHGDGYYLALEQKPVR
jgi:DNA-binding response OmpR family regulator